MKGEKMIEIQSWLEGFLNNIQETFGERAWFVGLQGSYGRGEATEKSDIDLVVILDTLASRDIAAYHAMLDALPHRELICGFLSGRDEILHWDAADLFQFYHDTLPIRGSLDDLLPLLDDAAVQRAIKMGACNIYHGCVHNMLYEKSDEILAGLYKAASFVLQALHFSRTGSYIRSRKELSEHLPADERGILETFAHLKEGGAANFTSMSEALFAWAQKQINT